MSPGPRTPVDGEGRIGVYSCYNLGVERGPSIVHDSVSGGPSGVVRGTPPSLDHCSTGCVRPVSDRRGFLDRSGLGTTGSVGVRLRTHLGTLESGSGQEVGLGNRWGIFLRQKDTPGF